MDDTLTVTGPRLLCLCLRWEPTSNLGSKLSLFRPGLRGKFCRVLLRPKTPSSTLPWYPRGTPSRTLCPSCVFVWVSSCLSV